MIKNLQDTYTLNNGVQMPGVGLGVYKADDGEEVTSAVRTAIDHGYRLIDTASFYGNERGVGEGIRESSMNQNDIFLTSKVWNDEQGYDETLRAFEASLGRFGFNNLDMYLIHWPVPGKFKETWKALERLYDERVIQAIGVSNFHKHHLEDLMKDANVKPAVNQVEYHPHLSQGELKPFCDKHDIRMQAWSPLKRGKLFDEPTVADIAREHGRTPAQIILRWDLQTGVATIPKSTNKERIVENADIFNFELSEHDMTRLKNMNIDDRTGPNPDEMFK
ncbi:aldo/keto reductase [Halalkalibacillus sediminis]|uniref:Aldo/keto reductase n=1 Tax=Halalkalibacillus sediminis TaxID=2018042 RepID=A0A2I0QU56_9BACI|nr:aldo/keto reductase [Halalkalibacillus sediminis]PKR77885.1 aldo/keto reductase [Halalkalibacillus sediminis]